MLLGDSQQLLFSVFSVSNLHASFAVASGESPVQRFTKGNCDRGLPEYWRWLTGTSAEEEEERGDAGTPTLTHCVDEDVLASLFPEMSKNQ